MPARLYQVVMQRVRRGESGQGALDASMTREEDEAVTERVRRHGLRALSSLAGHLPGRTARPIRAR